MIAPILALLMFAGASILDLRERRVQNRYWLPYVISGILLFVTVPIDFGVLLWVGIQLALFYLLWRVGLLFGGADAKGLMALAILWTGVPSAEGLTPAIDTLVNGLMVMLALPVAFFLWNGAHGRFSPAMFLAVPMNLRHAKAQFVWPMERVTRNGIRKKYLQTRGENLAEVYVELQRAGLDKIWATPKVPFMVPLLLGAGLTWAYGNVLFSLLGRVLSGS